MDSNLDRLRALTQEALTLCDQLGLPIAAAHYQHAVDAAELRVDAARLREPYPMPWGIPTEDLPPES